MPPATAFISSLVSSRLSAILFALFFFISFSPFPVYWLLLIFYLCLSGRGTVPMPPAMACNSSLVSSRLPAILFALFLFISFSPFQIYWLLSIFHLCLSGTGTVLPAPVIAFISFLVSFRLSVILFDLVLFISLSPFPAWRSLLIFYLCLSGRGTVSIPPAMAFISSFVSSRFPTILFALFFFILLSPFGCFLLGVSFCFLLLQSPCQTSIVFVNHWIY